MTELPRSPAGADAGGGTCVNPLVVGGRMPGAAGAGGRGGVGGGVGGGGGGGVGWRAGPVGRVTPGVGGVTATPAESGGGVQVASSTPLPGYSRTPVGGPGGPAGVVHGENT